MKFISTHDIYINSWTVYQLMKYISTHELYINSWNIYQLMNCILTHEIYINSWNRRVQHYNSYLTVHFWWSLNKDLVLMDIHGVTIGVNVTNLSGYICDRWYPSMEQLVLCSTHGWVKHYSLIHVESHQIISCKDCVIHGRQVLGNYRHYKADKLLRLGD